MAERANGAELLGSADQMTTSGAGSITTLASLNNWQMNKLAERARAELGCWMVSPVVAIILDVRKRTRPP
jgi:hypothetical protein